MMPDIQALRNQFEFWQAKYHTTKNYRYYSLFQYYFREYMRLIDSGVIPRSMIEKMLNRESVPKQGDNTTPLSPRQVSSHHGSLTLPGRLSLREESLMALFAKPEEGLTLRDIQKHISLGRTHLRDILRALVRKGKLEEERVKGRSVWRKRCP
jgi:hypothetical protein